jgi:hypothetical protein
MTEKRNVHPFERMMFGHRLREQDNEEIVEDLPKDNKEARIVNSAETDTSIDLVEIIGHVDTLMGSLSELKPLYRKLLPLLDKIKSS